MARQVTWPEPESAKTVNKRRHPRAGAANGNGNQKTRQRPAATGGPSETGGPLETSRDRRPVRDHLPTETSGRQRPWPWRTTSRDLLGRLLAKQPHSFNLLYWNYCVSHSGQAPGQSVVFDSPDLIHKVSSLSQSSLDVLTLTQGLFQTNPS